MLKREKEVFEALLTDEEAVISELEKAFQRALQDIEIKIKLLQADEMTQSKIYQLQYQRALKAQIEGIVEKLHGDSYTSIQQYLSDCYTNAFVGTMYALHGQGIPVLAPIDQNAAVRAVMTDSKINAGLYEALGVDTKALKKSIQREISVGLSSGATYAEITRNISFATGAPLSRAKTIVRTEGHRVQQASSADARNAAKAQGCSVVKQWDSTLDGKTRETHRELDGQIRETDKPFESSSGRKARYPGDFGDPAEDCNCRCVALTRATWDLDESELKTLKDRAAFFGLDKTDSFKDFEKKYLKAAETVENTGKSGIIDLGNNVPGFKAIQGKHDISDDIGTSQNPTCNPNFVTGRWGYTQNCQRCVQAYEFRRRGYNVIATERPIKDNAIVWGCECFTDANGNPVKFVFEQTPSMIKRVLDSAPDGSRYTIYVQWEGWGNGAHVFVAEKENGVVHYIDPQIGNMDATDYFNRGSSFGYFRMDDKQLTTDQTIINATVEEKK